MQLKVRMVPIATPDNRERMRIGGKKSLPSELLAAVQHSPPVPTTKNAMAVATNRSRRRPPAGQPGERGFDWAVSFHTK
jgi:hypothetical protein